MTRKRQTEAQIIAVLKEAQVGIEVHELCRKHGISDATFYEPISKSFEEHRDTGELYKAEEVGGVILPANEQPPFPLEPGKEAFDEPAPLIAA